MDFLFKILIKWNFNPQRSSINLGWIVEIFQAFLPFRNKVSKICLMKSIQRKEKLQNCINKINFLPWRGT
jgi:hypothetical protein